MRPLPDPKAITGKELTRRTDEQKEREIVSVEKKLCRRCRYFRYGKRKYSTCANRKSPFFRKELQHNGKLHPCKLYKSMEVRRGRCFDDSGLRCIEDLRGKYPKAEIWIIAPGPSLDEFPDDFFEGRIAIVVKQAASRFLHTTFFMGAYASMVGRYRPWLEDGNMDLLKKAILTVRYEFVHRPVWPAEYAKYPYYMRVFKARTRGWIGKAVGCIMEGVPCNYPGVDTIMHFGIQAAVVMGAQYITLAGCDAKAEKFRHYAKKGIEDLFRIIGKNLVVPVGGYSMEDQTGASKGWQNIRNGTLWLAEALAPHGIEVRRYFHGRGYEDGLYTEKFKGRL